MTQNYHDRIDAIQRRLEGARATALLMESNLRNERLSDQDFQSATIMLTIAIEEAQELLEKLKQVLP